MVLNWCATTPLGALKISRVATVSILIVFLLVLLWGGGAQIKKGPLLPSPADAHDVPFCIQYATMVTCKKVVIRSLGTADFSLHYNIFFLSQYYKILFQRSTASSS